MGSHFFVFCLFPVFLSSFTDLYAHDLLRMSQLVLVGACAVIARPVRRYHLSVTVVLLVLLAVIAVLQSGRWGLIEAFHLYLLVLCGWVWIDQLRSAPEPHLLASIVALPSAYIILVLMPRWAALMLEGLDLHHQEFFPYFNNPRFFGHWLTLSYSLMILASMCLKRRGMRYASIGVWCVLSLWIAFVLASGTRGSWFALLPASLIVAAIGRAGRRLSLQMLGSFCSGAAAYAVMFLVVPAFLTDTMPSTGAGHVTDFTTLSRRNELWALALNGVGEHPLVGNGPMMFSAAGSGAGAHPHNIVLQFAYEWGIPLTIVVIFAVMRLLWRCFGACRRDGENDLRVALFVSVCGGLIHAQVDGILIMPLSQTLFVLLFAWLISLDSHGKLSADRQYSVRAVLLPTALVLAALCYPEVKDLHGWENAGIEEDGIGIHLPRFWVRGSIVAN